jgi:2,3-bisphosphoglycerate-dependent phosphoglycerate mutase
MNRAVEVVHEVLASHATNTVLVSHGCLITLLLKHFDKRFGFAEWESLTNPDVFVLTVEQDKLRVDRLWKPL